MWSENDLNVAWYGDIQLGFFLLLDVKNIYFTLRWEVVEYVEVDVKKKTAYQLLLSINKAEKIPFHSEEQEKCVKPLYLWSFWLVRTLVPQLCHLWWEYMDNLRELEIADMKIWLQDLWGRGCLLSEGTLHVFWSIKVNEEHENHLTSRRKFMLESNPGSKPMLESEYNFTNGSFHFSF